MWIWEVVAKRRLVVDPGRDQREPLTQKLRCWQNSAMARAPWHSRGSGGMVSVASWEAVRPPGRHLRSGRRRRSDRGLPFRWPSAGGGEIGMPIWSEDHFGRARARCSPTLWSSREHSATSAAEKPSTSRRIRTARCWTGRCWRACDERKRNGLAGVVTGLGTDGRIIHQCVWVGVEPPRLVGANEPAVGAEIGLVTKVDCGRRVSSRRKFETAVRGDAVQPRSERSTVEATRARHADHENLLEHVLGVL